MLLPSSYGVRRTVKVASARTPGRCCLGAYLTHWSRAIQDGKCFRIPLHFGQQAEADLLRGRISGGHKFDQFPPCYVTLKPAPTARAMADSADAIPVPDEGGISPATIVSSANPACLLSVMYDQESKHLITLIPFSS